MACALVALITCTYALDQDSSKVYPNVRRGQRSPRLPSSGSIKRKTISEWLPQGDDMDRQIMSLYAPSLVNLALPSIPGALDTFWVGRFGDAISLAGQGVANQVFNSLFNILIFVPKVTAPLVARAFAAGDVEGVHDRTCNSLFVACALGALGMIALVGWPHHVLRTVLPEGALAAPFAGRYLRLRSLSAVAAAFSAVAFAAFRGTLNAVTPLRVAFCQNVLDMVLDPVLMFGTGLGVAGTAVATAAAEMCSACMYFVLLLRLRLASLKGILTPPNLRTVSLLMSGAADSVAENGEAHRSKAITGKRNSPSRWAALDVIGLPVTDVTLMLIMLARTKAAQSMDVSGLTGAAYSIAMTLYLLGETVSQAMQATSSAYIASRAAISVNEAALASKRVLGWSVILGCLVCTAQLTALPHLLRLFTPNAAIRAAAAPAVVVGALIQITNPACCAMEGTAMGIGMWGCLWKTNVVAQVLTILSLEFMMSQGCGLVGVMSSFGVLNLTILIGLAMRIYGKGGPLGMGNHDRVRSGADHVR